MINILSNIGSGLIHECETDVSDLLEVCCRGVWGCHERAIWLSASRFKAGSRRTMSSENMCFFLGSCSMCMFASKGINMTWQLDTGLPSTSATMGITANTLTRWDLRLLDYLNVTWTNIVANGFTIANNYRVSPADSVDIIVLAFAFSETAISTCIVFCAILLTILDLTMLSCMNWYVVCSSIVRRYVTNKRVKHILCLLLCVLHRQTNIQTAIILIDYTSIKHDVTSWWLFSNN